MQGRNRGGGRGAMPKNRRPSGFFTNKFVGTFKKSSTFWEKSALSQLLWLLQCEILATRLDKCPFKDGSLSQTTAAEMRILRGPYRLASVLCSTTTMIWLRTEPMLNDRYLGVFVSLLRPSGTNFRIHRAKPGMHTCRANITEVTRTDVRATVERHHVIDSLSVSK